jgi:glycerol-3-phosphate O-acyltransferase
MAFLVVAQSEGAHCSDTLVNTEWALDRAVRRFIHEGYVEAFEGDSGPIYRAVPEHRVALEFHKNTVVAFLATGSMLALALRSANADAVPRGQAIERFTALSEWWQDEFIFDPDQDIEARVARGASQLELFGAIEVQAERLRIVDRQRLDDYADLTVALLESYHLTARALRRLTGQRFDDNSALAQAIRQVGEGLLAVDEVRRPEALSSVTIRNALQRLGKADLFHLDRSGRLHLERERLRSWEDAMKIWRE